MAIEKQLTPCVERIIALAKLEAECDRSDFCGVQHLLMAMHKEGRNSGAFLMQEKGITIEQLRTFDFSKRQRGMGFLTALARYKKVRLALASLVIAFSALIVAFYSLLFR